VLCSQITIRIHVEPSLISILNGVRISISTDIMKAILDCIPESPIAAIFNHLVNSVCTLWGPFSAFFNRPISQCKDFLSKHNAVCKWSLNGVHLSITL